MPDYYYELRRQQAAAMEAALDVLEELGDEFQALTGRRYRALEEYRLGDAERALVCLGSTAGTAKDVVDELRSEGERIGLLKITSFRPLPGVEIRELLRKTDAVAVLDRADSPGGEPPLYAEVAVALAGEAPELRTYVYGLGGRDLHPADLREVFAGTAPHYVGLRTDVGLRSEPCPA
jgi:pyruvate ferredoxin oxidoreductase alpha subunit